MMPTKICSICKIDKEFKEYRKDQKGKYGRQACCKICKGIQDKEWYLKNKQKHYEGCRNWVKRNPDKVLKYSNDFRKKNPEKCKEFSAQWRKNNKEYFNEKSKAWTKTHRGYRASLQVKREKCKILRTPIWLTEDDYRFMIKFYEESDRLTKETGIKYNVDHIVPLQGKNVSGLHVPWNLQVITAIENMSKHNKYDD